MRRAHHFLTCLIITTWMQISVAADSAIPTDVLPTQLPETPTTAITTNLADISPQQEELEDTPYELSATGSNFPIMLTLLPLIGTLFGALIGGGVTIWREKTNIKLQQLLAQNKANLDIGNSFSQWQLKQLSELYGPLHALLCQSNALYRHMNAVLALKEPGKFRLIESNSTDEFDKKNFEMLQDGKWVQFRTIVHISLVYGKGYGIEDYFDEIVNLGRHIATVISEKAGYTRPESTELLKVFGRYLAHYTVMDRLHKHVKGCFLSDPRFSPCNQIVVDETATFPRKIQKLVEEDFLALNQSLEKWRTQYCS